MILAASCVPPVLPGKGFRGEQVLDGGMIDNVPALLADDRPGATLVLLSKRHPADPCPTSRVGPTCSPSRPITLDKFDYANPEGTG